jgi:hypothetical protein
MQRVTPVEDVKACYMPGRGLSIESRRKHQLSDTNDGRIVSMQTRLFALTIGVVYLLVGVVGFIPALYTKPPLTAPHVDVTASYGYLLGIFPVNALHNIVHILVGLSGIVAGSRFALARYYCIVLFLVYGVLTVMGFIPTLDTTWGLIPIFGSDTWLHAASTIAAAYFGFVAPEPTHVTPAAEVAPAN